jgi:FkbM family methyltransferase
MKHVLRPLPFVLVSTNHGTLIVNRNDVREVSADYRYGVGWQLLNTSSFEQSEVDFAMALLESRYRHFGPGVVAVDCGANVGVHTVEWGRQMQAWGHVWAFEAQEKIFYALAGNVVLNNCLNVTARHCAVGASCGSIGVPQPDYLVPSSYGSLELRQRAQHEYIGQTIDYGRTEQVPLISLDSLALPRLDFIKIDVEGMEAEVLRGAEAAIRAHRPSMLVEIIKSDRPEIEGLLRGWGYHLYPMQINILAVHETDPVRQELQIGEGTIQLADVSSILG